MQFRFDLEAMQLKYNFIITRSSDCPKMLFNPTPNPYISIPIVFNGRVRGRHERKGSITYCIAYTSVTWNHWLFDASVKMDH